jgi:hypothetical protein
MQSIKNEYFILHRDPFIKDVIQAVSKGQFESLIDQVTQPVV